MADKKKQQRARAERNHESQARDKESTYEVHFHGPTHGVTVGDNARANIAFRGIETPHENRAPFLLPSPPTQPLVGRDTLLQSVKGRLFSTRGVALTALNGLPGVGKTELARTLVHDQEVQGHFSDGILWASLGRNGDVISQLAEWGSALGVEQILTVPEKGKQTLGQAIRRAIGMRRMLLVVDDAWSVDDALAFQVGGPFCSYMTTTRLHEVALYFTGTSSADAIVSVRELSAEYGLALLDKIAPQAVAAAPDDAKELVQSVGGLPLALTIMGSYLRKESHLGQPRRIRQALDRLKEVEARLTLEMPQPPLERHPSLPHDAALSLKAVIEISVQLLDEPVSGALRKLAVFGPKPVTFSEKAAKHITSIPGAHLDALVDSGLLEVDGADRYAMHQTIFDFLSGDSLEGDVVLSMIRYYADLLADNQKNYALIESEMENIISMLNWAGRAQEEMVLVTSITNLFSYLNAKGQYATAYHFLYMAEALAKLTGYKQGLAQVYRRLGILTDIHQDYEAAKRYLQEALALAREIEDGWEQAHILGNLSVFETNRGNTAEGERYLEESLVYAREKKDKALLGNLLSNKGAVLLSHGNYEEAVQCLEEALVQARGSKDKEHISNALLNLGAAEYYVGKTRTGDKHIRMGIKACREVGNYQHLANRLRRVGEHMFKQGDNARAKELYQEAVGYAHKAETPSELSNILRGLARIAMAEKDYAEARNYVNEAIEVRRDFARENEHSPEFRTIFGVELQELYSLAGSIATQGGDLEGAKVQFNEALTYARKCGDDFGVCWQLIQLSNVARDAGNLAEAVDYARQAATSCADPECKERVGVALAYLGQVAQDADRTAEAI